MRNIVSASHDNHSLRMKFDDVGSETDEHLRRGLTAYASSAKIVVAEEVRMIISPVFGYGIAHKNDIGIIAARLDSVVVSLEPVETEPILRKSEK